MFLMIVRKKYMFLMFSLGENTDLCNGKRVGLQIFLGVSLKTRPGSIIQSGTSI